MVRTPGFFEGKPTLLSHLKNLGRIRRGDLGLEAVDSDSEEGYFGWGHRSVPGDASGHSDEKKDEEPLPKWQRPNTRSSTRTQQPSSAQAAAAQQTTDLSYLCQRFPCLDKMAVAELKALLRQVGTDRHKILWYLGLIHQSACVNSSQRRACGSAAVPPAWHIGVVQLFLIAAYKATGALPYRIAGHK
jgi:hypothetical protein